MNIRHPHKRARMEMLPLMDVVFLLLVFFIYAMLFMVEQRGMTVALPSSRTAVQQNLAVIALTIDSENNIYVDKESVGVEELPILLRQKVAEDQLLNTEGRKASKDDASVQIFADEHIEYSRLYEVLDAVKLSGIRKISLQARQK